MHQDSKYKNSKIEACLLCLQNSKDSVAQWSKEQILRN